MSESINQKGFTQKGGCHLHEEHRKSRRFQKFVGFTEKTNKGFGFSSAINDNKQRERRTNFNSSAEN